jgi:pimeloyl-ACP methyl ester carboxylesterase
VILLKRATNHTDVGDREVIIFVHGLVGTISGFKREITECGKTYRCIAYNLIGHGDDRGEKKAFTMELLVQQLKEVYETNNITRAHLCCLSYGGYIGTLFSQQYPEYVQSICYIGGHYNNPSELFDVFHTHYHKKSTTYKSWLKAYARAIYPKGKFWDSHYSIVSESIYYKWGLQLEESIIREAIRHRLEIPIKHIIARLQIPVLWVMGERDELYKSCLYDLHEVNPRIRYHEIPSAGHAANVFRPSAFLEQYRGFLTAVN